MVDGDISLNPHRVAQAGALRAQPSDLRHGREQGQRARPLASPAAAQQDARNRQNRNAVALAGHHHGSHRPLGAHVYLVMILKTADEPGEC